MGDSSSTGIFDQNHVHSTIHPTPGSQQKQIHTRILNEIRNV